MHCTCKKIGSKKNVCDENVMSVIDTMWIATRVARASKARSFQNKRYSSRRGKDRIRTQRLLLGRLYWEIRFNQQPIKLLVSVCCQEMWYLLFKIIWWTMNHISNSFCNATRTTNYLTSCLPHDRYTYIIISITSRTYFS